MSKVALTELIGFPIGTNSFRAILYSGFKKKVFSEMYKIIIIWSCLRNDFSPKSL